MALIMTKEFKRTMALIGRHIKNGGTVDADIRHVNAFEVGHPFEHTFDGTWFDVMTVTLS